jgi:carbamate kinase
MSKRIVVAMGGNAILYKEASAAAQQQEVIKICKSIANLIMEGYEVIITHGNGPQVGNLHLQQRAANSPENPIFPLDSCVAMTQGSIGYWLQNALSNILHKLGCDRDVVSLITQVEVDATDPAFSAPTKPIGPFLSKQKALQEKEAMGGSYMEDAGRGWRKVVPSPHPIDIIEKTSIKKLIDNGTIVICCGGGGIPIIKSKDGYQGVEAVIDKDLVAELLATELQADTLLILTGVDNVYVDFGKDTQRALFQVSSSELRKLITEGQFSPGSILPKIEAAIRFTESKKGRRTIITSLKNAGLIDEGMGTHII